MGLLGGGLLGISRFFINFAGKLKNGRAMVDITNGTSLACLIRTRRACFPASQYQMLSVKSLSKSY